MFQNSRTVQNKQRIIFNSVHNYNFQANEAIKNSFFSIFHELKIKKPEYLEQCSEQLEELRTICKLLGGDRRKNGFFEKNCFIRLQL